jgi:hypothetical protein
MRIATDVLSKIWDRSQIYMFKNHSEYNLNNIGALLSLLDVETWVYIKSRAIRAKI